MRPKNDAMAELSGTWCLGPVEVIVTAKAEAWGTHLTWYEEDESDSVVTQLMILMSGFW